MASAAMQVQQVESDPQGYLVAGAVQAPRLWQSAKAGQVAFWATALFTAQLYLSPGQWFPVLAPLHHALVLSLLGMGALFLGRFLTNKPLWMGWRTAFLALYAGEAVLSLVWTIDRTSTIHSAVEVVKHFLFFLALVNTANTVQRIRTAMMLFAVSAIAPGWGTFNNWIHDEMLVEGFRGRWLGVMADPNHDAMALVAAVPLLLLLAMGAGHPLWKRALGVVGAAACLMGIIATHSRGGSLGLGIAVVVFALMSRRKAIAGLVVLVATAGVLVLAPRSYWERNETIAGYAEDLSVRGRIEAWEVAGRAFHEHPLLGG